MEEGTKSSIHEWPRRKRGILRGTGGFGFFAGRTDEGEFLGAGELFEGVFAFKGGGEGAEGFEVLQDDGAAGAGVAGGAFGVVVVVEAAGDVGGVAGVEGGVGTAEEVDEVAGGGRAA